MAKYPNASFRLGDLAPELFARGKNAGQIAKRDLDRFYSLLRRARPRFNESEAGLIIDALDLLQTQEKQRLQRTSRSLQGSDLVDEYRNALSAAVGRAEDIFTLSEKYDVDMEHLESRLRGLDACQELAVIDAVEQAFRLEERDARKAAVKVGLA